jgi:prepilin-type processing-associated H-X9-DG protein
VSLPQHITQNVGGTVSIDLLTRPTTVTLDIYTGEGASIVSAASGTVSTISTTLSAAPSRGDVSITVGANTGIAAGSVFWIQDDPEAVLAYKVATTTISLRRPLLKDHASGATVQGTRCSYTVLAAAANVLFFDGRVKWTIDGVTEWTALECTKYPLKRHCSIQDVIDRQPMLYEILTPGVDTERLLDLAHDEVLERIGVLGRRIRVFPASSEFVSATAMAALMLHYQPQATDEGTRLYERYESLTQREVERVVEITPRDDNQDGVVQAAEKVSMRSVILRR